ncbi:hypothetical protein NIES37_31340 [Tolypothrix tenuis PCC 7101]|uniref:Uncharacterized protein n=1 Tax=Tolypothrix tenuis PCC 7101 TaxID=231146 RepID=A0A1Z4N0A9_9CYAN|nr:hypothetical protein NIES37_31340 [Tolypothrix tenuis PCC 7101]BAZ76922.1 hypothetical protein NIES50_55240 [Aulosira laxa NIES-50]
MLIEANVIFLTILLILEIIRNSKPEFTYAICNLFDLAYSFIHFNLVVIKIHPVSF